MSKARQQYLFMTYQRNNETAEQTLVLQFQQTVHIICHYPKSQELQFHHYAFQPDQQTAILSLFFPVCSNKLH